MSFVNRIRLLIVATAYVFIFPLAADTGLLTLENNPFSRPQILKKKPSPVRVIVPAALPPEEIEMELTATMVSETTPMVIVNGELLGVGEKIGKMKLIAVMEGKAIFIQDGKKFPFEVGETN
ncbi:MAG: hypothetical protein GY785_18845 [Gammaproteobacteria bacterium]|nr:hypothetical protein [Gammaproteobacteria bacterium]